MIARALPPLLLLALALPACDERDDDTDDGTSGVDTNAPIDTDEPPIDAFEATAIEVTTDENTAVVIDARAENTAPSGLPLTVTAIDVEDALGTITLESSGQIAWAPGGAFDFLQDDEEDEDVFGYTITDGEEVGVGTVTVVVTGVNDPPNLRPISDQQHTEGDAVTLALVATDPDDETLQWSSTGLPPGLGLAQSGLISGSLAYTAHDDSPHAVVVTVSDGRVSVDRSFTWTVDQGDQPPELTNPGPQSHPEGATVSLGLVGVDPEGEPLTWSATGLPPHLAIAPATGVISGEITAIASENSPYAVVVTASDGTKSTNMAFQWVVTYVNHPPVAGTIADRTGDNADAEGDSVTIPLTVTDPDTNDTHTWTANPLPDGISVVGSSLTGTLSYDAAASYTVTATVSDGTVSDATSFTWTVTNTNRPPDAWTIPPATVDEGAPITAIDASTSDPDGDAITYADLNGTLPSDLSLNANTGLITGTPTFEAAGVYPVTIRATDVHDDYTDSTFTLTVNDVNRPPEVTAPSPGPIAEGEAASLQVDAYDPDTDALEFTATGLPTGLSIDLTTGVIEGTVGYFAFVDAPYEVTVTVTDGTDPVQVSFEWEVTNTNRPPTLGNLVDRTDTEGQSVSYPISATDADLADSTVLDSLTFSVENSDANSPYVLPPGLSLNPSTGQISGTLTYLAAAYSPYELTVTVTDLAGAADEGTFTWTVDEGDAPLCPRAFRDVTAEVFPDGDAPSGWAMAWFDWLDDGAHDVFVREGGFFENGKSGFVDTSGAFDQDDGKPDFGEGDRGIAVADIDVNGTIDVFVPNDTTDLERTSRAYHSFEGAFYDFSGNMLPRVEHDPRASFLLYYPPLVESPLLFTSTSAGPGWMLANVMGQWSDQSKNFGLNDLTGDAMAAAPITSLDVPGLFVASGGQDAPHHRFYVPEFNSGSFSRWNDEAAERGLAGSGDGARIGGVTWADIDDDGRLDLHIVRAELPDLVYLQGQDGKFHEHPAESFGLGDGSSTTSAAVWGDFDLDGRLDVLIPDVGLFRNDGKGAFTDVTEDVRLEAPSGMQIGAWVDVDGDGDLDIALMGPGQTLRIYRNDVGEPSADDDCFVPETTTVRVVEEAVRGVYYDALGAMVEVDLDGNGDFLGGDDGKLAIHLVGHAQSGRASQSQLWPVIGHGRSESVDVRVTWPGGHQQTFVGVEPGSGFMPKLLEPERP